MTSLLPALVGLNKAREMLFLGERYDAPALLALGVAWRVVPDQQLLEEANTIAARLAGLPPLATQAMKRVLNRAAVTDVRAALALETEATVAGMLDPQTTRLMTDNFSRQADSNPPRRAIRPSVMTGRVPVETQRTTSAQPHGDRHTELQHRITAKSPIAAAPTGMSL